MYISISWGTLRSDLVLHFVQGYKKTQNVYKDIFPPTDEYQTFRFLTSISLKVSVKTRYHDLRHHGSCKRDVAQAVPVTRTKEWINEHYQIEKEGDRK